MRILKGIFTALVASILLLVALVPVATLAFLKLLIPSEAGKRKIAGALARFAEFWLLCNRTCYQWIHRPVWLQELPANLARDHSYLVLCNHRSWSDIPVLLFLLLGKTPFFRFLMKRVLVWLPVVGWGAWALDFPLLYRFSQRHLERNPADRTKDQESLEKLCTRIKDQPATIIIFAEGTRFTAAKHAARRSPYRNLLAPRSGGVALLLQGLGEQFEECLDFTLVYKQGTSGFWHFLTGAIEVQVQLQQRPIPPHFKQAEPTRNTAESRKLTKQWLAKIWQEKDLLIDDSKVF